MLLRFQPMRFLVIESRDSRDLCYAFVRIGLVALVGMMCLHIE